MRQISLYTGNGASLSPDGEERTLSAYVRLVADEGMVLKNGEHKAIVVDVLATMVTEWKEIPDEEQVDLAGPEDYEQALEEMGVNFNDQE